MGSLAGKNLSAEAVAELGLVDPVLPEHSFLAASLVSPHAFSLPVQGEK
ncbi:hypothetical protein AB4Y87_24985 [Paenarthrobacter sp. RAF54_2]